MRARLVRPDATTEPVDLPPSPADARAVMNSVIGCDTVDVVRVLHPGPADPGVDMWADDEGLVAEDPVLNLAAAAIVAFLSCRQVRQPFAGPVLFTGGPTPAGATAPLTGDYDEIIVTIAGQLRGVS
jgi:Domain of unknown function (DUF3846)